MNPPSAPPLPQSSSTAPARFDFNARALKAAREKATQDGLAVETAYRQRALKNITDWQSLSLKSKVPIPDYFFTKPFNYAEVTAFTRFWSQSVEARTKGQLNGISSPIIPQSLSPDAPEEALSPIISLLPEQLVVRNKIIKTLFYPDDPNDPINRVLQDGRGGAGKTFIAAGVLKKVFTDDLWKLNPISDRLPYRCVVITRKTIVPQYTRDLINCGLKEYLDSGQLLVTRYSALSASFGQIFMTERYDVETDDYVLQANPIVRPALIIEDECHALNNPATKQTKFIEAWQSLNPPPKILAMSATPFITINHSRTFLIDSGFQYPGVGRVTPKNFDNFAGLMCRRPDKPNKAAAKRLREVLGPRIISIPYVRWKHKAINQILIIDFEDDAARQRVAKAFAIYLESKRRAGEKTSHISGSLAEMLALGQFRKAAEPEHNYAMCELMARYHTQGYAPVMFCAFKESIADMVYRLHKKGIPREKISIIWGGKRKFREDRLLTKEQMSDIISRASRDVNSVENWEIKALKETSLYITERARLDLTEDEQIKRNQQLEELGLLGAQSSAARQYEIDNFQSGVTEVCLATLSAGGVGLSLDQNKLSLRPRVGFFTPSYSGPEFQQALFRLIRRMTVSDVEQFLVYLKGTVEETHVAPMVDVNLKCIAAITGAQFSLLDFDTAPRHQAHKFRTAEEILKDADADAARVESVDETEEPEEGEGEEDDAE